MALLLRLRALPITEPALLEAIEQTPRDRFVPVHFIDRPYHSRGFPMALGQTMTGVDQVIRTVQALHIEPHHAVLEIGTGTGYQTALMARLAKKIVTIDRFRTLLQQAQGRFEHLVLENIVTQHVDGDAELPNFGLFDRIVANGVYASPPKKFLDQLASGGTMVTAIGQLEKQQMLVRLTKVGSRFDRQDLFPVRMSPFQSGVADYL